MLVDANGVLVGVIGFELRCGGGALIGDIRIGRADGEWTISDGKDAASGDFGSRQAGWGGEIFVELRGEIIGEIGDHEVAEFRGLGGEQRGSAVFQARAFIIREEESLVLDDGAAD